jgi:hypothetical protein
VAPWLGCLAAHGAVLRCFRTGLIMPGERGVTVMLGIPCTVALHHPLAGIIMGGLVALAG